MALKPFSTIPQNLRDWTRYLQSVTVEADSALTAVSAQTADLAENATNAVNAAIADLATLATSAASADDAALLGGELPSYYRNADNINAGTLADARIPSTIARDTEVAAAVTSHEALADAHPVYAREASAATITGAWAYSTPFTLPSYTVAGVPSAATYTAGLIYVSNESGGATLAFSNGVNWLRVQDRVIIS
jgi:hypothetical protein